MRKIAVIIGSKSDLTQCHKGLRILSRNQEEVQVVGVYIRSQHRNTLETQELLRELTKMEVDIAIVGAGWANHLTGCCDAYLRYTLKNNRLVVIGVAFEDKQNERHTNAAILSVTEVPGTQVIFEDDGFPNVGESGFIRACVLAIDGDLPKIKIPEPRPTMDLSLEEALEISQS